MNLLKEEEEKNEQDDLELHQFDDFMNKQENIEKKDDIVYFLTDFSVEFKTKVNKFGNFEFKPIKPEYGISVSKKSKFKCVSVDGMIYFGQISS